MSKSQIEHIRLDEKNKLKRLINELEHFNNTDTINRTRLSGLKVDNYNMKQIEKLKTSIIDRETRINELSERLGKIDNGELDNELLNLVKINTQDANVKHNQKIKEKLEKKKEKDEDAKISKEYYESHRKDQYKASEKGYASAAKFFFKTVDNLPDWVHEKLRPIPYNQGIIHKGIWLSGYKNTRSHENSFTEFQKGLQKIYKWDADYNYLYEKKSREQPVLVSKTFRKKF